MENRDIRIAFFDIDGTLLPPDHHLPESTVARSTFCAPKGCSFTWQPAVRRTTCTT